MTTYSLADVERLTGLPSATVRSLVKARLLNPGRGARGALRFSFQDLGVLRTAETLLGAGVPKRGLTRALRALRERADPDQYPLSFRPDATPAQLRPSARMKADPQALFEQALDLEARDPAAAIATYRRAIEAHAACAEMHINLGRLLHESGALAEALAVYDAAVSHCGPDALLSFNRAVLLEDLEQPDRAVAAYEEALSADPDLADAHYNLSLLHERLGRGREALRHMAEYRRRQTA